MEYKHDDIEAGNTIENYLMGRLDPEEELAFEEHMLGCQECRQKCRDLQKIIEASESYFVMGSNTLEKGENKNASIGKRLGIFLSAAAAIALLVGTVFLVQNKRKPSDLAIQKIPVYDTAIVSRDKQLPENYDAADTLQEERKEIPEKRPGEIPSESKDKMLIAEAFNTNPVFESAIEDQLRSEGLTVNSPVNSAVFKINQEITFKWQIAKNDNLTLIIRDNTGKTRLKEKTGSDYIYTISTPGLYYWQLMENDNMIYTGKFSVK